jgi:hypothetical protein
MDSECVRNGPGGFLLPDSVQNQRAISAHISSVSIVHDIESGVTQVLGRVPCQTVNATCIKDFNAYARTP